MSLLTERFIWEQRCYEHPAPAERQLKLRQPVFRFASTVAIVFKRASPLKGFET